jgi:hypothetical protein
VEPKRVYLAKRTTTEVYIASNTVAHKERFPIN